METPKPVRNWRGYFKEYAIIVIGVLTALAAQQAAEWWHDRGRAAEARINVRAEIANNLRLLNLREVTEACIAKRLDEAGALIAALAAGQPPQKTIWIGTPDAYALLDSRYKAATQTGAFSLFDDREQALYARFYAFFAAYFQSEIDEAKAWADLRILEDRPTSGAALDATLRSALKQARLHRYQLQRIRTQLLTSAKRIDLAPDPMGRIPKKSVCLPLHTPRAEAVELVVRDRTDGGTYDVP